MSTITNSWSEEKISEIIAKLDEKTGLHGADLPIYFKDWKIRLGCYHHGNGKFGFNERFLNDPNTKESEVIEIIRHEYAHYCVDVAESITGNYEPHGHGANWKRACRIVGANPSTTLAHSDFLDRELGLEEAEYAHNANDLTPFDITAYVEKWDQLPVDPECGARYTARIKENNPNSYFEVGDEILHPKMGFGTVAETVPCDFSTQKMYVRFENGEKEVFKATEICKMVNGVAIPYSSKE